MALATLFLDGFDHYASADILKKWTEESGATIVTTLARSGGKALRIANGALKWVTKVLPGDYRTAVIGVAFNPSGLGSSSSDYYLIQLRSGTSAQITLGFNTVGQVEVRRGTATGTLLATSTDSLPTAAWSYVEFRVLIDGTNGEYEVRVNGLSVLSGTGNTQALAGNTFNVLRLAPVSSSASAHYDDLYVRAAPGLEAGGFLGDCKVLTRYPQGPGAYSQLTPVGAAANWQAVNETPPNGDSSYVSSATVGHKDLYDVQALGDPGAIKAVQLSLFARKEDAGTRLLKPLIKSGATEQAGAAQALSTDYQYKTQIWETNPATGNPFTASGLDNAEWGLEVSS